MTRKLDDDKEYVIMGFTETNTVPGGSIYLSSEEGTKSVKEAIYVTTIHYFAVPSGKVNNELDDLLEEEVIKI